MSLDRLLNQPPESPDQFVDPIANYQMKVLDYVVRASAPAGNVTITLPPVAEAKGQWYSIIMTADTNNLIIADKNDSEYWPGDITLTDTGDGVLAYSDGRCWICFARNENLPS